MKKYILSALLPVFIFLYTFLPTLSAGESAPRAPFNAPSRSPKISAQATSSQNSALDDPLSHAAVGGNACILYDDVFFYSEPNDKRGVFLLPKTYYVKILSLSPDYCQIEYLYDAAHVKRLVGYAKTAELTFVPYVPKQPYLYKLFDVRYRLDNDSVSLTSGVMGEITVTCAYYGDYKIGSQTYCYVLRDNVFGYVPKPDELTYDDNAEYTAWLNEQLQDVVGDNVQTPDPSATPAQIAILIALCLLVPVLAALVLRTGKRQPLEDDD